MHIQAYNLLLPGLIPIDVNLERDALTIITHGDNLEIIVTSDSELKAKTSCKRALLQGKYHNVSLLNDLQKFSNKFLLCDSQNLQSVGAGLDETIGNKTTLRKYLQDAFTDSIMHYAYKKGLLYFSISQQDIVLAKLLGITALTCKAQYLMNFIMEDTNYVYIQAEGTKIYVCSAMNDNVFIRAFDYYTKQDYEYYMALLSWELNIMERPVMLFNLGDDNKLNFAYPFSNMTVKQIEYCDLATTTCV